MAKNPDKKSSEYWEKRFQELENRQHGMSVKRAREIMVNFDMATSEIEQKITYWYQRIANNNNISLQEARKLLSDAQLKEFKWSVDDYIKYGKQNAIDGRWMKELENASARAHISRLEALKLQVRNEIEKAYASSEEELAGHMESVFKDSMYHTAYELQKGLDHCETFAKVSPERVRKVMDKPWCPDGKTFSARIWEDRDRLVNSLDTQLTRMCITGAAPDKVIKEMTKLLGAKKSNVARLVMTESAYISSAAQKECFKELDVEQYKVLAVLDSKTSEICQEMDGQVFKMSEYQEGVTAPPFHPNCRSTTIPYFDDEWFKGGSRSARDKDGNYIEVPEDMTYAEWKREFVDGEGLKEAKQDDKMKLKDDIYSVNTRIDELNNQFREIAYGNSYSDWFKDFKSIEEGFGEDASEYALEISKLKDIDQKIRAASREKFELLLKKERRGQLDTGYRGKIPDDKIEEYNSKAFDQIKVDTGYSDEKAKEFHDAMKEYCGGGYETILSGETETAKIIRDGIDMMPIYDGCVYRGMTFTNEDVKLFSNLKPGDMVPSKGIIESWSSNERVAMSFGDIQGYERSSVILECVENKTGVGVQHISKFGSREAEVLSSANYEVVEVMIENKYDYLSQHKEFLWFPDDLDYSEMSMKENVVCRIRVKEKN